MADNKPEWIPYYVWSVFLGIQRVPQRDDGFHGSVKKLLTDSALKPTWERLGAALKSVDFKFQMDAAAAVTGGICNPVRFYGATGTTASPTPKITIRKNYAKAQSHLQTASNHLLKAVEEIREATQHSSMLPDEALTIAGMVMRIFEEAGYEDAISLSKIPDYFWNYNKGLRTAVFLKEIAAKLTPGIDPWADIPGMRSNKASWRDWLAEAVANLEKASAIYGADFSLIEADWVALAKILINPAISRDSVRDALRSAAS